MHAFSTFGLLVSKKGLEEGTTGYLIFPFPLCHHFQHKLLTSEKEYKRVSWLFVFLRTSLPSFCLWSRSSSCSNRKHGLSGLSALTAYLAVDVTHLPVLTLSPTEFPHITGPLGFCAHGASGRLFAFGTARDSSGCAYCTYLLSSHTCSTVPSVITYKTQVQKFNLLRISRWQQEEN